MIDVIETIDKLTIAIDKIEAGKIDDAIDDLKTFKSKKEDEHDTFEKDMKKMPIGELANDPIK